MIQASAPQLEMGADDSPQAWRAALACQNVRYVVFYKTELDATQQADSQALERALFAGVAPVYEDAALRAYGRLQDVAREAFWTPVLEQWYPTETNKRGITYRWAKGTQGAVLAYPCGSRQVVLRFNAFSFAVPRRVEIRLDGELVRTDQLPGEQVVPVAVPLTLRDGENRIELRSAQPANAAAERGFANDNRSVSINLSAVSIRSQ